MWFYRPEDDDFHCSLENGSKPFGEHDVILFSSDAPPTDAQGPVMAEALNVHEQTGLTPAQLQARVAELEGALRAVETLFGPLARDSTQKTWLDKAQELLRA